MANYDEIKPGDIYFIRGYTKVQVMRKMKGTLHYSRIKPTLYRTSNSVIQVRYLEDSARHHVGEIQDIHCSELWKERKDA